MKKRVLSVLLVIALLVTVGIVAAQANETDPTPAEIKAEAQTVITAAKAMTFEEGNLPTYCPKCGDNVTWTAITKESYDANTNHAYQGHFYLAESFEVDVAGLAFNFQGASCLHLNGNGVKNVTTGSWNCVLRGNTELNIFDNAAGTGYIDGGTTQGAIWGGVATTNIYGGTYKGTNGTATIEIRGNNFVNFFDGDLESGHIRFTSVASSAFQMYGGTLSSTGSIKSNEGSATTEALVGIHGGDVDMTVNTWGKKVVVTGGSIKTLTSAVPTGTSGISISGNPQIETLGLSASYVYPTFGVLTEGASIGFGTYTGVISTAYDDPDLAQEVADSFPKTLGGEATLDTENMVLVWGKRTYTPEEIVTESAKQTFELAAGATSVNEFCYACGEYKDWLPLNALADTTKNYKGITGHYFLAAEEITSSASEGTIYANAAGTLCLHLNGNKISNTAAFSAIRNWSATMNVMGTGTVSGKGNSNWGAFHGAGPVANIYGGTYETNNAGYLAMAFGAGNNNVYAATVTSGKGVVRIQCQYASSSPSVTIYGGTYPNKLLMYNKQGPSMALTIKGGTFNNIDAISDLTIEGGTINGAITSTVATTITGGTINNTVTASAGTLAVSGGTVNNTVTVSGATATVSNGNLAALTVTSGNATVSGGTVSTLTASAGNVAVSGGTVTTANISGTAATTLTNAPALSTLNLATGVVVNAEGLTGGAINLGTTSGVFTTAFDGAGLAADAKEFFVADPHMEITVTGDNELSHVARSYTIEQKVALSTEQDFGNTNEVVNKWCYHCGSYQNWTPLSEGGTGTITLATGHYYLNNNIKFTGATAEQYGFNIGTESHVVCLHLNGNDITADGQTYTAIRAWSGNLNLMGEGLVQNKADVWAALCVNYGATTNIYGGQFQNIYGTAEQALDFRATTVNIYDATVLDNNVMRVIPNNSGRHPVVTVHSGTYPAVSVIPNAATFDNATLNVKGGAITTLTAGGIVNVEGGTVTTLANSEKSKTITLSGAPTIGAVDLTAGTVKLTVGELVSGASIGLGTTSGVFTTALASKPAAEAVISYFEVEGTNVVTVTNLFELTYGAKVYTPEEIVELSAQQTFGTEETVAFCYVCGKDVTWKPVTKATQAWYDEMSSVNSDKKYHYFVANDITADTSTGIFYMASWGHEGTFCLHMNGKTLENTNALGAVIKQHNYRCKVNVMGDGTLISNSMNFAPIYVGGGDATHTDAGVNVYFAGELYGKGGNNYAITASSEYGYLNVYGCNIPEDVIAINNGLNATIYGGDIDYVSVNTATANLLVQGGDIDTLRMQAVSENVVINGGNIGTILTNENGGTVKLTGAPTVKAISLAEGKVLDLNGMTGGSLNVGSFEGVFTTAFTGGESAANTVAALVSSPTKAIAVTDLNELTTAAAAAAVVNGDNQKAYATYAQAEQAYTNGYIKLFGNDAINLTKDVTIDFNGHNVDVTGSVELTGFDSTTKDSFANEPGYMTIADTITVKVPEATTENGTVSGYLAVEDDYTTFTYYTMKLSGVALKAKASQNDVGMFYKGTWSFNNYLPEGKVEAGVVVNVTAAPTASFKTDSYNGWYSMDAAKVTNGAPVTSILVNGIMKKDGSLTATQNDTRGNADIHAAAFITIGDQVIMTGVRSMSICDVLTAIESNTDAFEANESKLYGEGKFYDVWKTYANFATWNLPKYEVYYPAA